MATFGKQGSASNVMIQPAQALKLQALEALMCLEESKEKGTMVDLQEIMQYMRDKSATGKSAQPTPVVVREVLEDLAKSGQVVCKNMSLPLSSRDRIGKDEHVEVQDGQLYLVEHGFGLSGSVRTRVRSAKRKRQGREEAITKVLEDVVERATLRPKGNIIEKKPHEREQSPRTAVTPRAKTMGHAKVRNATKSGKGAVVSEDTVAPKSAAKVRKARKSGGGSSELSPVPKSVRSRSNERNSNAVSRKRPRSASLLSVTAAKPAKRTKSTRSKADKAVLPTTQASPRITRTSKRIRSSKVISVSRPEESEASLDMAVEQSVSGSLVVEGGENESGRRGIWSSMMDKCSIM